MDPQYLGRLQKGHWFQSVEPAVQKALVSIGRVTKLKSQHAVYRQGDEPNGFYAVLEGQVRLESFTEAGAGFLMLAARAGDWFGETATLDGLPRQQDAVTFGSSVLLHIATSDIERTAVKLPQVWRALGALGTRHQRAALAYIQWLNYAGTEARVARLLMAMKARSTTEAVEISHDQLAANIGVSRQTISAVLHRLRDAGIITLDYGAITVSKPTELARLV